MHADARATTLIVPSYELSTVALPVVEMGTLVEIKSEKVVYGESQTRGRYYHADRMQHLMGLADHVAESSPFQQWLAENGAELEFDDSGNPKRMRIDTIPLD